MPYRKIFLRRKRALKIKITRTMSISRTNGFRNVHFGKITLFLSRFVYSGYMAAGKAFSFVLISRNLNKLTRMGSVRAKSHPPSLLPPQLRLSMWKIRQAMIFAILFRSWLMFSIASIHPTENDIDALNLKIYKSTVASNANWCSFGVFIL